MNYRKLGNTGLSVSVLGYGASPLGNVFRPINEADGIRTVHLALDLGINLLDVSPYYGNTRAETVLGKALKGIQRDRYILATKVGQYGDGEFDFSAERVTRSLDESCGRLGVDYIDLLQCHDIEFADLEQIANETLPALVKLKEQGRIGHIGVTGLPLKIFPEILKRVSPGTIDTILSFCHYSLNDSSLDSIIPELQEKQLGIINAAPTSMGLLTPRGAPDWHPATPEIKEGCRQAVESCEREGIDIVKLAVQWAISDPRVATTVIGTANPESIRKNAAYTEAPIDFAAIARILEVLKPIHNHNFTRGRPENRDPLFPNS